MIKPTQKLIDTCLSIISNGNMELLTSKKNHFFDDLDLSTPEVKDTLQQLIQLQRINNMDLSEIKMPYKEYLLGIFSKGTASIESWTDSVKWPQDIGFDPQKILEESKQPIGTSTLHEQATGTNIGIAIIDQRLYLDHPEYYDIIKHYEVIGKWPQNNQTTPDYHGSLVVGCAAGKTTGTAPNADIYYIAANNWPVSNEEKLQMGHRYFYNMAIKRILEINKTLPENKKIRFLSCSWGTVNDQFYEESNELFAECEKNGIMVLGGAYKADRNKFRQCNQSGETILSNGQNLTEKYKVFTGIPTDCKTTPFFQGGYIYKKVGGSSSTFPYLAGVFACACQDNQIFFTRPNWQEELLQIMTETSTINDQGGKMINPIGIRDRVSQIAREMEMNLIKQQSLQNE